MLEELPVYVKLKNAYNPAHYPANKKISAEEWNALWMSVMYQGNHQEDILASILNITLPEHIASINEALTDINLKQNITDNTLNTTSKTIVGAINELLTNKVDKVTGERLINAAEIVKLTNIAPNAQVNIIESISVNTIPLSVIDKNVNIIMPTKVSDLTNDSNFQTGTDVGNSISTHNTSETAHSDIRALIPVGLVYDLENNALSLELPDESLLSINLPVESDDVDGLSPAGTGTQIAAQELRIQQLEVRGAWKGLFPTYASLPETTPDESFVGGSVIVNDYIEVSVDEEQSNASTKYRVTAIDEEDGTITWTFAGVLTSAIPLATNSSPGLVKGSTIAGKSYAEADGTLSVNGWDTLNTTVGNKVDKVAGKDLSANDLTNELKTNYDTAYSHSQLTTGNPHSVTKTDLSLDNVDNTADANKEVLSATKLKTAITIGGISFDGSSSIALPGVNQLGNQDTTGLANTRCIKVVTTTGTAPNYVITVPEVNDYTDLYLYVKFHQATTGAAWINVNGQGESRLERERLNLIDAGGSWSSTVRVITTGIYLIKVGTAVSTIKEVDGAKGFLLDHYYSNGVYLLDGALLPNSDSNIAIGQSNRKFTSGYFSTNVITPTLNNGADIAIPNITGDILVNAGTQSITGLKTISVSGDNQLNITRGDGYFKFILEDIDGFEYIDTYRGVTLRQNAIDSLYLGRYFLNPSTTNICSLGTSTKKFTNLYLSQKAYIQTLNNGGDIVIPTSAGTMALAATTLAGYGITDARLYRHRILLVSATGRTQIIINITNQSSTAFTITTLVALLRESLGYNDGTSFAEKIDCGGVIANTTPTYFVPLCIGVDASTGNTLRVAYIDTNVIVSLPFSVNTFTDTVIAL